MTETVWSKAADLIKLNGWTTGTAQDVNGCMCVGGALTAALGFADPEMMWCDLEEPSIHQAFSRFADHVEYNVYGRPAVRVWEWNDWRATKEGVLKALQELHEAEVASTT